MRKAIFPGSFDPFTLGHLDILKRSLPLFDEIVVGVGNNIEKKTMFSVDQRISFIKNCFLKEQKIKVKSYDGLTADFCEKIDSKYIVRGLRNSSDFEFEKKIAHFNNSLNNLETIFVLTSPENSFISSSIVREIINNNGDFKKFVPKSVKI